MKNIKYLIVFVLCILVKQGWAEFSADPKIGSSKPKDLFGGYLSDSLFYSVNEDDEKTIVVYKVVDGAVCLIPVKKIIVPIKICNKYFLNRVAENLATGHDTFSIYEERLLSKFTPYKRFFMPPSVDETYKTDGFVFNKQTMEFEILKNAIWHDVKTYSDTGFSFAFLMEGSISIMFSALVLFLVLFHVLKIKKINDVISTYRNVFICIFIVFGSLISSIMFSRFTSSYTYFIGPMVIPTVLLLASTLIFSAYINQVSEIEPVDKKT